MFEFLINKHHHHLICPFALRQMPYQPANYFGMQFDTSKLGAGSLITFIIAVCVPLALASYLFYCQLVTLNVVEELKTCPQYQRKSKQDELTNMYASTIILLVIVGGILLSGAYVLGAGVVSIATGSMSFQMK